MVDKLEGGTRLAVLGHPIAHSRSPRIHRAAYELLELPWQYDAIDCDEAGLAGLLAGMTTEWRGLSLTMPLKDEARRLSLVLDPVAEESGVVNTLLHLSGGIGWAGFNTDVMGLAAAIRDAGLDPRRTIVLGSGATAMSALLAVRSLGAEKVTVLARNAGAVAGLVARFSGTRDPRFEHALRVEGVSTQTVETLSPAELGAATLVISVLPGPASAEVDLPDGLTAVPLFDVAYDPWPSPLAERWRAAGGVAHSGLDMLVQQALLQLRIFVAGDPNTPLDRDAEVLAEMRRAAV